MWRSYCLALALSACGSSKNNATANDACVAYAQRTAELMYVGFERGAHGMAQYVKPEFVAAVATPLAPYCREHVPAEHAACVAAAKTASDADACALDPARMAETTKFLRELVLNAAEVANLPATESECRAAGAEAVRQMQVAAAMTKLPSSDQVAALCVHDRWTADYARCTAAKQRDCLAKPEVKAGVQKLLADLQR
jgi:hypothetical protein